MLAGLTRNHFVGPVLRSPHLAALVVATGAFFLVTAALYVSAAWPTGDEPHYLVISETLLKYHSLDVVKTYQNHDYLSFYKDTLDLSHTVTNDQGIRVPVHGVGGPILWLPFFAVAGRMGAVLFIVGVSLLVIVDIFRFMHEQGISKSSAVAVAGVFAAATPFFAFAHLIFIDLLGAWAVIHLFRKILKEGELRNREIFCGSLLLGIQPWVHVKFIVVAALLLLFLLARIVAGNRLIPVRAIPSGARAHWKQVCWAVLPAAVLGLGYEMFTHAMWNSFDPLLAYGQGDRTFPLTASPVRGLAGTFLDQEYGVFITAPILVLAIPGFVLAVGDRVRPMNIYFTVLAVCYLSLFVARSDWQGGFTPPGRFILVLLPLFAYYIGYLLDKQNRPLARAAFWAFGALGTAYNLVSLQSPSHGFSSGVGQNQTIVYIQQLLLHRSFTQYLPSTVKEIDYTKVLIWAAVVALVSGLTLLRLPGLKQNLALPGLPLEEG